MAMKGYCRAPLTRALPSDGLMLYPGHSLVRGSYLLCREAVGVIYSLHLQLTELLGISFPTFLMPIKISNSSLES